jgi:hypothetical protein
VTITSQAVRSVNFIAAPHDSASQPHHRFRRAPARRRILPRFVSC